MWWATSSTHSPCYALSSISESVWRIVPWGLALLSPWYSPNLVRLNWRKSEEFVADMLMDFYLISFSITMLQVPQNVSNILKTLLLFSCWAVSDSFGTPWTVVCQAPLSVAFPRQEYWNGLPFPSLGDLSNPGIKPTSPPLETDSLPLSHRGSPLRSYSFVNLGHLGNI